MTRADEINPAHYQAICHCPRCGHAIEAISVTERFSFTLGNCLKYLLRAGKKGDRLTDYRKAAWYLQREIAAEQARRGAGRGATGASDVSAAKDTPQPVPGLYGAENEGVQE